MLIAHVTDFHVLEAGVATRRGLDRARLTMLANGRPVDPEDRRGRVARALATVREARPDHVCITGDLTEDGTDAQFELLAELLADSGLAPSKVTLVPGNHDAYARADGFARALEGPLADYRETSALGGIVELRDLVVLPVSTSIAQCFVRAAGFVGDEGRDRLERGLRHARARRVPAIVAMHHPPVRKGRNPIAWFDDLIDDHAVARLLAPHAGASVLHGHLHRHTNARFGEHVHARVHGALAVADHPRPVRFYRASERGLEDVA